MSAPPARSSHASLTGSVPILAVDDLPANLLAVEAIVEALGHELVGVRSGLEALSVASTREFAAIVLDVSMPGLDGLETLKRLREIAAARATPVIFLTAHRFDAAMIQRAYQLGAVDYLEKPVTSELLGGKLASFVALYQQRREIARQAEVLRVQDRHMGILAHELRAPLTTAREAARQLQHHQDLTVRIVADRIARSTAELAQLMEGIVASARTATGLRLQPERTDLSSLVEQLVDDFRATYEGLRFSTALACDVLGLWDPARLRQVLSALLSAAVKHGKGLITVETRAGSQAASVVVENGQCVLSPEELAQIFDPIAVPGGLDAGGMALGLSVAKEIVQAHGGELRAEVDRKGMRFILSLPQLQR